MYFGNTNLLKVLLIDRVMLYINLPIFFQTEVCSILVCLFIAQILAQIGCFSDFILFWPLILVSYNAKDIIQVN